jgi:hypothetical protein
MQIEDVHLPEKKRKNFINYNLSETSHNICKKITQERFNIKATECDYGGSIFN